MDPGKRKTLIEWVNSLAVDESIESLHNLQDGRHLLALANLVEGVPRQSDIDSRDERWDLIAAHLEGLYECNRVNKKAIINDCHEFEIAKACLLLMSAAMLCERNSVFVERAMQMEVMLQHEIREMIEWVVQPNQNLVDLDPCFDQVLSKPLDKRSGANSPNLQDLCTYEMKELDPQASSTPQSCNQRNRTAQASSTPTMNLARKEAVGNTSMFSTSILGRFTSPVPSHTMSPMSPVQQMVQSPHMANKIRMQQKEAKIRQLERELMSKRNLVSEYENEIEEKRRDADHKEKDLRENQERLHQAMRKLQQLQLEVDDLRLASNMSMTNASESQRIVELKNEKTELSHRNKHLEEENTTLYTQLHTLQKQVGQLENIHEQMSQYQLRLRESERQTCDLRTALAEKELFVAQLSEANQHAHAELTALCDNHHQELHELQERLELASGSMVGSGESLEGVMEMKFTEELDNLRAEINEYDQKLQQKANHVLELLSSNEQLMNEKSELTAANGHLHNQIDHLRHEFDVTKQNLSESIEKSQSLEASLNELQKTSGLRIAVLESQSKTSQSENKQLLKQLTASQEAINNLQSAMQGAHEAFAQQKESLLQQICTAQADIAMLEKSVQSTKSMLTSTQTELNLIKSQMHSAEVTFGKECEEKDAMIQKLKEQVKFTEEKLSTIERNLAQELAKREATVAAVTVELSEAKHELVNTQETLRNQCVEMEQNSAQAREEAGRLVLQFEEQLTAKSEELAQVYTAMVTVTKKAAEETDGYKIIKAQLEGQLQSLSEELAQAEAKRQQLCKNTQEEAKLQNTVKAQLEEKLIAKSEELGRVEVGKANICKKVQEEAEIHNLVTVQLEEQLTAKSEELSHAEVGRKNAQEEVEKYKTMCLQLEEQIQIKSKELAIVEATRLDVSKKAQDVAESHAMIRTELEEQLSDKAEELEHILSELMSAKEELVNFEEMAKNQEIELSQQKVLVDITKKELERLAEIVKEKVDQVEKHEHCSTVLHHDLLCAEDLLQSKDTTLTELKATFSEAESRIRDLGEEIKQHMVTAEDQKRDLLHELELARTNRAQLEEQVQSKSAELSKINLSNAQQQEEYETHIMTLAQDLSSAQELIQAKEDELDQSKAAISDADGQVKMLRTKVQEHERITEKQKQELARQLDMATMSGDNQREAVQRLSLQLQEATIKGEKSQNALGLLQKECAEKERQWNSKVDEFEKTVGQVGELQQQLQETEIELRQVGEQLELVSKQLKDTEKTRDAFIVRVQEQESAMSQLNEQLLESETRAEEHNTKAVNLERQLVAIREENVHIRQELNAECERIEAMEVELMETQQKAEQTEEDLQQKLELAWQVQDSVQSEMANMREKSRTLEDQCEHLHQKLCEVCDCLQQTRAEGECREQDLSMKLEEAEENRHAILEEFQDAQFNISTLQEELEESKERGSTLEENVEHHRNNTELIEARLKEFMEDKEGETGTLMTELTDTDNKLRDARRLETETRQALGQLQQQSVHKEAELNSQLEALTAQLGEAVAKATSMEESLKVAQQALFNTEKEKEEVQQTLLKSRLSLSGKEDHLGSIQEKVRKLKEELSASDERVCQLQETLSIYEQKASDLESRHQQAETEAERKEMRLESDLEKAQEEIEELTSKVCLLEEERGEVVARFTKEEIALKEAQLEESALRQELAVTRVELAVRHESLQNMAVQHVNQVGQMENAMSEVNAKGSAVCIEYEQRMTHLHQEATIQCQKYDVQVQDLRAVLQQTKSVAQDTVQKLQNEMSNREVEQKEEVMVLGRQIDSLSGELQSLKCWEISERTSIKELEKKCMEMEVQLSKNRKENLVLTLKLEATQKQLADVECQLLAEKSKLAEQLNSVNQLEAELRTELDTVKSELLKARAQYTEEIANLESKRNESVCALELQNVQLMVQYREASEALDEARSELDEVKHQHVEELMELEEQCAQMETIMEKQAERSVQSSELNKNHDEALSQQKDEHFAHVAEVELNYQLEVERLEGELEKLKSEKAHLQDLLAAVQEKAAAAQNDAHSEIISLEKDKLNLEGKLESRDRQLKKDVLRSQRLQEVKAMDIAESQQHARQLEREMHKMMEREKRHLEAHRRETSLGADMNAKLQQQLGERETELQACREEYNAEIRELTNQVSVMQERYNADLKKLEEKNDETFDQEISTWRRKFEQLSIAFNKLEDRHATSESERQRLVETAHVADANRATESDRATQLEAELLAVRAEKEHCEEQLQEASNLKNQLREEEMINKRLGNQARSLEAQLDHASRQLKAEGLTRTRVPPPPPPPFPETPASLRRSIRNGKPKETTFDSAQSPKSSSDDEFTKPYKLRSKMSEGILSPKDLTVTPGTEGRYLSRLSFAGSLGPTPRKSPSAGSEGSSGGNTTILQQDTARFDRCESLSISSTGSHESTRSNNVPFGTGSLFSAEDEPIEFEWDRLSELQRRNTLCLPHLKSSYPTEVQSVKKNKISEQDVRVGEPLDVSPLEDGIDTRLRSRKRTSTDVFHEEKADNQRKMFVGPSLNKSSTATLNGSSGVTLKVYPHYSPHAGHTPKHKLARSSPRGTPPARANRATCTTALLVTPKGDKMKGKAGTPKGATPRWNRWRKGSTPNTPKKGNENSTPKPKKSPMSFNIGFTPKKSRRLPQILRRKKTSVEETPKEKAPKVKQTLMKPVKMKPLGDHNRR